MERFPADLLDAPVNRQLESREHLQPEDNRVQNGYSTNKVPENSQALLVFVSGVVTAVACKAECNDKLAYCFMPHPDLDYNGKKEKKKKS